MNSPLLVRASARPVRPQTCVCLCFSVGCSHAGCRGSRSIVAADGGERQWARNPHPGRRATTSGEGSSSSSSDESGVGKDGGGRKKKMRFKRFFTTECRDRCVSAVACQAIRVHAIHSRGRAEGERVEVGRCRVVADLRLLALSIDMTDSHLIAAHCSYPLSVPSDGVGLCGET